MSAPSAPRSPLLARCKPLALALAALAASLVAGRAEAFYLPGVSPETFKPGEAVEIKVNRLTSANTQLSLEAYELPFCRPAKVQNAAENLGEILSGARIENTAYDLKLYEESKCKILCRKEYTKEEVEQFKEKIDDEYSINYLVDNLPAATHIPIPGSTVTFLAYDHGYRVGGTIRTTGSAADEPPQYYLNNHVRFTISYHQPSADSEDARIVGFELEPYSINHEAGRKGQKWDDANPPALCQTELLHKFDGDYPCKIGTPSNPTNAVVWTYDVKWEPSDVKWASRWDIYLSAGAAETSEVHWFSIVNSILIVVFLSGMVAMILVRTLHKDLTRYNRVLTDEEKAEELEETGWKLVHADVFRAPAMPMLFSVTYGTGVQVLGMSVVTLFFAAIGFLSPANRGSLIVALLLLFVFMGVLSGYASARQYKQFDGKQWQRATLVTAFFYPTIIFAVLFFLNLIVWAEGSTNALPFGSMVAVVAIWFCVSVPLVFVGSYFGYRKDVDKLPVKTQDIPRQIPSQPWYMSAPVTICLASVLPFGATFVELFFILSTLWLDSFYYVYGFLVLVFLILLVTCAEISIVLTYFQLCGEDYRWWWRSFFTSGGSAMYVFLYSLHWYTLKLHSTKFVTHVLFFGYMSIISLLFFLGTGAIGYYASYWFVVKIFGSIKVD